MVLARVAELAVSREITAVKARLQRMNPVDDQTAYNRLYGDLMGLEVRRRALVEQVDGA
jgi:DNA primase